MKVAIQIPKGYDVKREGKNIAISKNGKENKRELFYPLIDIKVNGEFIELESKIENKNIKKIIMTFESHIKNMIRGLEKPYIYTLKICASHYPMTVKVEGKKVIINNYLGEKVPRHCNIIGNAKVSINKDLIIVESIDKEAAGMTAGIIEKVCQIKIHDRRIFQDGIYIIEKDGKKI
ncbi:MAG: 50S ribosomal protein L6 [Candidatus Nanoarchaeia archaeon]|nr:50S ribosomal protein L6 [Candidatus Nanoarchaeia archaeon]